jgi:trans-aconitate 2-methyltransferase
VSPHRGPRDWDAASYDRVSGPQATWAGPVLDRLDLDGTETVLDAGCGAGRVTALLLERLPDGAVVATDAAPSMVEQAHAAFAGQPRVEVLDPVDLTELELDEPVDAVFSNAVFHWVPDHDRLFRRLYAALRPGGRMAAQCGGEGNIAAFHAVAARVGSEAPYADYLGGWRGPWNFASPQETEPRLRAAGFEEVACWLEPWPVEPPEPLVYLRTVCLGAHLLQLPDQLRDRYVRAVTQRCGEPLELDYVRLNIAARRPVRA